MNIELIKERVTELSGLLVIKISNTPIKFNELSEKEKIPFKIMAAEITALKQYMNGIDLPSRLTSQVDIENFTEAEGIKRANDWLRAAG